MKKIILLLLCAAVFLASCQKEESATPVSKVTISKTLLSLIEGTKELLTSTVLPADATDKRVTWLSSDISVATISDGGEVMAISSGSSTITMTSVDNKAKSATCLVTVTKPIVLVTEVSLNKQTLTLLIGKKEALIANVLPINATDKSVVWTSSNEAVATVSATGEVVAVSAGTATIKVSSAADNTKSATCEITVTTEVIAVTNVTLNKPTLSLVIGSKEVLTSTVSPNNATNNSVVWTSSNEAVATVSATGEVVAVSAGTATIKVSSVADNTKSATCEITVTKEIIAVTLVGINNKPLSLLIGGKATLVVTVLPDNATNKSVTYTSSNTTVATVSAAGEVSSTGTGVATITVVSISDNTKTDECVVTVTAPVVNTAEIGNFYYLEDNTQTKILDKTKVCSGIVFWVDPNNNQKGKIVSIDERELAWGVDLELTGANNNTNGRANMYTLNEFIRKSTNSVWGNYPAFDWVATVKNKRPVGGWADTDRWYLPAQGELVTLWGLEGATMKAVNVSLNSISGAVPLTTNLYCSSTEKDASNAIFVSFSTGFSQDLFKFSDNRVRAIYLF